jgi:hypothetical protein
LPRSLDLEEEQLQASTGAPNASPRASISARE